MDYNLNTEHKSTTRQAFIKMMTFMKEERKQLFFALSVMFINSCISLFTPYLIGYTVDHYIVTKLYRGLLLFCGLLLALYIISTLTQYIQIKLMGNIDNDALQPRMRCSIKYSNCRWHSSIKINRDLISRINNDTQTVISFFPIIDAIY